MKTRPLKIVFLDRGTLGDRVAPRALELDHVLETHEQTRADETAARIAGADVVITNKVRIGSNELEAAPKLKLIVVAATGYDCIDVRACSERKIAVANVRGYAVTSVPEHVLALTLALRRNLQSYHRAVAAGRWRHAAQFCFHDFPIMDLAGSTFGIVGRGGLGQAVANLATALGAKVQFAGRKGAAETPSGYVAFDEFLKTSDIVTLHCPLTPETRGLIGSREFAVMTRRPLLINVGRGGLVDEVALGDALRSGAIAGAGFDVATVEPPTEAHPLMALMELPNFILTPHVAWASQSSMQTLADQVMAIIEAFADGRPCNLVNG